MRGSRPSIGILAPLYIAMPVVLLGFILSYIWNTQSRDSVEQISAEYIDQIHAFVQSEIDEIVAMPPRISRINKKLFEEGFLDPNDFSSWENTFKEQFYTFRWLSAIVWGDSSGRALWIGRYSDENIYWAIKENSESELMTEWRLDEYGYRIQESKSDFAIATIQGRYETGEKILRDYCHGRIRTKWK